MGDNAAEPLIAHGGTRNGYAYNNEEEEDRERRGSYDDGEDHGVEGDVDEGLLGTPGKFIWVLTCCAGLSGLLFGYDSTSFFALLASPLTGILADSLGRKPVILIADALFVLGALLQAFTSTVPGMIAGRSIVGAAVGSASFVVPLYIGEVAPGPFRGRLVVVGSLFITGGQVVAYIIGWLFSMELHGWRWMVGLGAAPAILQCIVMWWMPETPRWLVKAGKKEQARRVLNDVYQRGSDGTVEQSLVNGVLRRVEREILEEEDVVGGLTRDLTKTGFTAKVNQVQDNFAQLVNVGGNRRALTIACLLQGAQQLCGFNSLMYFSATIFSLVGFRSPTLTSLSIALTNFIFTLVAFHYIDRIGRRRILLLSVPFMIVGLALCAVAFVFLRLPTEADTVDVGAGDGGVSVVAQGMVWPVVILVAMVIYVAGYAVGMGNVPWQQSELFPLSVRSLGSALATTTNWGSNTIVGLTFLPMMEFCTPTGTFALYALVCACALGAIWRIYPETAGLSLEDVGGLLKDGWGVDESIKRSRERRRER
ncbi:general substrate transporter [Periconia macrospinosa]|uniref:General substrate transporter n=1 Tax=Periconia macrospinosa TaxID=97972 RepID=A0A2V1ECJ5_9PLEO|nr:general substrate transporter [Periconia macrospinosa]